MHPVSMKFTAEPKYKRPKDFLFLHELPFSLKLFSRPHNGYRLLTFGTLYIELSLQVFQKANPFSSHSFQDLFTHTQTRHKDTHLPDTHPLAFTHPRIHLTLTLTHSLSHINSQTRTQCQQLLHAFNRQFFPWPTNSYSETLFWFVVLLLVRFGLTCPALKGKVQYQ